MSRDPAVAAVEGLFGVSRRREADPTQRAEANLALWICTCYSDDDTAPIWLVYDRASDGRLAWSRVPNEIEPLDLVHAKDTAGDHTSPADVLAWLERAEAVPWLSPYSGGDSVVLDALRDKILAG